MAEKKTANKKKKGKKVKKKAKKKKKKTEKVEAEESGKVVCLEKFALVSVRVGKDGAEMLKKKSLGYIEIPEGVPQSNVTVPLSGTFNMGNFNAIKVGVTISGVTIDNPKARRIRFKELLPEALDMLAITAKAVAQRMFNKDLEAQDDDE
jgi:hypothetical protein